MESERRAIQRLSAEFREMPGMRLTPAQVQRLCGVDSDACRGALDALVVTRVLRRNRDGTYSRMNA